jgi:thiol-disulfide isomerase/thioredoxin
VDIQNVEGTAKTISRHQSGVELEEQHAPEIPRGVKMKAAAPNMDLNDVNEPVGQGTADFREKDSVKRRKEKNPGSCLATGMERFLTDVLGSPRKCEMGETGSNTLDDDTQTCSRPIVYGKFAELKDTSRPENSEEVKATEEMDSLKIIRNSLDELTKTAMRSLKSYKQFLYDVLQELQDNNGKSVDNNLSASNVTGENNSPISKEEGKKSTETVANSTSANINFTDSTKKKIQCAGKNFTENTTAEVHVVDSVILHQKLNPKNETEGTCTLVMFYAPWCVFCARTAPHYNALARAFPQMDVLAIDAVHFSRYE